jgi:hypothetical protein
LASRPVKKAWTVRGVSSAIGIVSIKAERSSGQIGGFADGFEIKRVVGEN